MVEVLDPRPLDSLDLHSWSFRRFSFPRSRSSSCLCPWQSHNFGEPGWLYFHVGASKPSSTAFRDRHWRWWPLGRSGMGSGSAWSHAQQVGDGNLTRFFEAFLTDFEKGQKAQLGRSVAEDKVEFCPLLSYYPTIGNETWEARDTKRSAG